MVRPVLVLADFRAITCHAGGTFVATRPTAADTTVGIVYPLGHKGDGVHHLTRSGKLTNKTELLFSPTKGRTVA